MAASIFMMQRYVKTIIVATNILFFYQKSFQRIGKAWEFFLFSLFDGTILTAPQRFGGPALMIPDAGLCPCPPGLQSLQAIHSDP